MAGFSGAGMIAFLLGFVVITGGLFIAVTGLLYLWAAFLSDEA